MQRDGTVQAASMALAGYRDDFARGQQSQGLAQALASLQARARNEIGNVHRVIMTKDAELSASKDKLSGLKEVSLIVPVDVQLQFCVNGEIVEVAGSFNGWHKQIKMNLHPSSKTVDLQGSRTIENHLCLSSDAIEIIPYD
ncbi:hypothetical protein IEQ34_019797 [Dendrobium chrysotoxum]|uniref:AMP-activated protein kinase glycogen-binding domain-containing protein n=1 Tax=Dendrobium chrysotoxum TaxID=161865 RepID=A0AAV7G9H3_DENCH|nr:hypothetical protein IEQ34_019797 [Dendrobium chrysotoxum]